MIEFPVNLPPDVWKAIQEAADDATLAKIIHEDLSKGSCRECQKKTDIDSLDTLDGLCYSCFKKKKI